MERDHPLALELASLRGAVSKYQHSSHQSGIQLQGSRLEYTLLAEKVKGLETENTRLQTEVEVLRSNPPIISPTPDSLALKQLTLAHRKLSALLTSTEQALAEKTTDLVNCQAELARTIMDRNLCRKSEDETRMMWNDMDDKIDAEKDLRWKVQVDRDLCNSIIEQYQKLYPAFVPVVPPPKPWHDPPPPTPPKDLDAIPTRSIPDLFAGRPGLEKLLSDFHAETKVLKAELREAKMLAAEAAKKLVLEEKGAEAERVLRADAINELDRKSRDDRAAAGVVERYMAFSQTSSLALHSSLQNLRIRHTATLATLNAQIVELQRMFGEEQARGQALLRSLGTLGEEVGRESAGRRREIGLRLAALGREERILETVRRWEEKARNALRRSTTPLNGETSSSQPPSPDPTTTTLVQLINDASNLVSTISSSEEDLSSSAAKILLAEDLAAGLIEELRAETETRVALEREKRELLGDASMRSASAAVASKPPLVLEEATVLIDVSTTEEEEKDLPPLNLNGTNTQQDRLLITSPFTSPTTSLPPLPTPVPSDTPLLHSLKTIASLHLPLQHSFHTLHQSLLSLQSTLSSPSPDPPIPHQPILLSAVERLMDISEDARVELEIHVDDEVRVAGGFVAILEVGGTGKVEEEASAFVEGRRGRNKVGEVFRRRLEDLEYDAAALKSALYPSFHRSLSSSSSSPSSPPPSSPPSQTSAYNNLPSPSLFGPSKPSVYINPLTALNLRNAMPYFSPPPNTNNNGASPTSPLSSFRRPSFANIGRLFSDGSGAGSIGVQHHSGASPKGAGGTGARGVGMMYKEARRSSSALGLRGMAGLAGGGGGGAVSAGPSSPMGRERDVEAGKPEVEEEEKEELLVDEEEEESSGDEVE